jgi:hypothetical protein
MCVRWLLLCIFCRSTQHHLPHDNDVSSFNKKNYSLNFFFLLVLSVVLIDRRERIFSYEITLNFFLRLIVWSQCTYQGFIANYTFFCLFFLLLVRSVA